MMVEPLLFPQVTTSKKVWKDFSIISGCIAIANAIPSIGCHVAVLFIAILSALRKKLAIVGFS